MTVRVTESGRMLSLVVARQTINGREFPIRKSVVASAGDEFPDEQLNDRVLEFAKNGERGLEYVDGDSSSEETDGGDGADEPVEGYDALNSEKAQEAYESEEDPEVKQAILEYELAHKNRAWAQKAQADLQSGGGNS